MMSKSFRLFGVLLMLMNAPLAFSGEKLSSVRARVRCAISKLALLSRTNIGDLGKVLRGIPVEETHGDPNFDPGSIVSIYQLGSRITVIRRNGLGVSTEATYILSDNDLNLVRSHYPAHKLSAPALKGKTILDAGCGGGSAIGALRKELGIPDHDLSVRGFDIYFPKNFNRPSYLFEGDLKEIHEKVAPNSIDLVLATR